MKTTIRTIALAVLVAIASLSQTVIAQTGEHSMKVKVPFAFDCGKQHFSPGVYSVTISNQNVLSLRTGERSAWAMIQIGNDPTEHESGYVVFRKYGERYFLAEYVPTNGSIHASVFESGAERRAARVLAATNPTPQRVQLAMLSNVDTPAPAK